MFKNSDDEKLWEKVLLAYQQEFGASNLILSIPQAEENPQLDPMTIRHWQKNLYRITVKKCTANFELRPREDE